MMKMVTRALAVMISVMMLIGAFAACGGETQNAGTTTPSASTPAESTPAEGTAPAPATPDISKHVDLTLYLFGDPTPDFNSVLAELTS